MLAVSYTYSAHLDFLCSTASETSSCRTEIAMQGATRVNNVAFNFLINLGLPCFSNLTAQARAYSG